MRFELTPALRSIAPCVWLSVLSGLALLTGCAGDTAPPAGAAPPVDPRTDAYVYDDAVVRSYDLELTAADWQWLQDNAQLEQYVPGTLTFEGDTWANVGVRFKGGFGSLNGCFDAMGNLTCSKLPMKIKFNEYDPAGRFFGLKRLQFHGMERDPSLMHEAIGYGLFRAAGVTTSRTAYARLRINGMDQGLFVLVEQMDGRFTAKHFAAEGGDGNLYKEVWPMHLASPPYIAALRTNETMPQVSAMVAFATELSTATDATFFDVLGARMDIDYVYRYLAVDRGIMNWDGIMSWYCFRGGCNNHNYFWYEETVSGRMWLLPWDLDHSFGEDLWVNMLGIDPWRAPMPNCTPTPLRIIPGAAVRPAGCDPLIDRLGRLGRDRFAVAAQAFLDGAFQEAAVLASIDRYQALIAPEVATDARGPGTATFEWAATQLRAAIPMLRARLAAEAVP